MSSIKGFTLLTVMLLAAPLAVAADPPSREEIVKLVEANLAASQALDVDAVRATIHPDSPSWSSVPQMARQLSAYELSLEARSIDLIGMAGDYALIRVLQDTRKISGPEFVDNALDGVWALRQDDGKWLFWSQMILNLEPLEPETN